MEKRPVYRPYTYLTQTSAFLPFWSDDEGNMTNKTLFHNPEVNFVVGHGYEDGENDYEKLTIKKQFDPPVAVEDLYQSPFETHHQYQHRLMVISGRATEETAPTGYPFEFTGLIHPDNKAALQAEKEKRSWFSALKKRW